MGARGTTPHVTRAAEFRHLGHAVAVGRRPASLVGATGRPHGSLVVDRAGASGVRTHVAASRRTATRMDGDLWRPMPQGAGLPSWIGRRSLRCGDAPTEVVLVDPGFVEAARGACRVALRGVPSASSMSSGNGIPIWIKAKGAGTQPDRRPWPPDHLPGLSGRADAQLRALCSALPGDRPRCARRRQGSTRMKSEDKVTGDPKKRLGAADRTRATATDLTDRTKAHGRGPDGPDEGHGRGPDGPDKGHGHGPVGPDEGHGRGPDGRGSNGYGEADATSSREADRSLDAPRRGEAALLSHPRSPGEE